MQQTLAVIGGGAAGFFGAMNAAELNPDLKIHLFEKGTSFLSKVKISGGGRCNVTHACFEPMVLVKNYPRGFKELLGPFYIFQPEDTIHWFTQRNVNIIAEADGRMFPDTNSSQTIIDCFIAETKKHGIELHLQTGLKTLIKNANNTYTLELTNKSNFNCDYVLFASGSSNQVWKILEDLGHSIVTPVPSLFTFNIKDVRIEGLMGLSVQNAKCKIVDTKFEEEGPLLITHWGLSGPAILKLSARAARELFTQQYHFKISINYIPEHNYQSCLEILLNNKTISPKKTVQLTNNFNLPNRLYKSLCVFSGIESHLNWSDITKDRIQILAKTITESIYEVRGKSTFKDEFVTCGGVQLQEVDFKRMESKILPNVFFAGEVLNIDAITGGFNFQAAWTTAFIASTAIAQGGN